MAIFKLGAIVTGIVGSVGGTTFKRSGGNLVMSAKSFGASKTKLLRNNQLGAIRSIFTMWRDLSALQRDNWTASALLFTFPDKFGVSRNITGRQLFTKLNIQLLPVGGSVVDTAGITSALPDFELALDNVDLDESLFLVIIDNFGSSVNFMFSVEQSNNILFTGSVASRKIIKVVTVTGYQVVNLYSEVLQEYPYFNVNSSAVVYVTAINSFGFKSVTQSVIYNP